MKLGIVGTGKIVKTLLPGLRDWGWEPTAICGTERSRLEMERLCREYAIPAGYTDYGGLLTEELDAVYVAVPNHLHFDFIRRALVAGKNVIAEKPITANARELEALAALAREKNLFLFEAVTTLYMPAFRKTREWLPMIGKVKLASCNFSQYSSRYDAFRRGEILPVFDPEKCGGTLMDLNIYNLHYLAGLFGAPCKAVYHANVERGIDTSGILVLDYGTFQAVCVGAKDCDGPSGCTIQGTEGYLRMDAPANCCGSVTLHRNDGTEEVFCEEPEHRMEPEFRFFAEEIASGNREECSRLLEHSLLVSRIQTEARLGAGIVFPSDGE